MNISHINQKLIIDLSKEVNEYLELNFFEKLKYNFENEILNIIKKKYFKDIKIFEQLEETTTLTGEDLGLNSKEKVLNNIKNNVAKHFLKNKMYDEVLNNIGYYSSEEVVKLFKEASDNDILSSFSKLKQSDNYKDNIRYQKNKDNLDLIIGILIIKKPNIKDNILEIFPELEEKKSNKNNVKFK